MPAVTSNARVLLVDDHPEVLRQTARLLTGEFEIAGALSSGAGLLDFAASERPDFIVLDVSLPGLSGLELASRLRRTDCPAKIIFLTVHADEDYVRAALEAGANGYVLKSRMITDLPEALAAAKAGGFFVSKGAGLDSTGTGNPGESNS
jgi:DNA-binding NarL/FixJ family response regulator